MTEYFVNFSGGLSSYLAAKRLVARSIKPTLVFADTLNEDEDLYRFLDEAVAKLDCKFVRLCDGRDIWEVFKAKRFLGNTRIDPCSRILKRELLDKWYEQHANPDTAVRCLGYDWSEEHRLERSRKAMAPWRIEAPLTGPPYLNKNQMATEVRGDGIEPPRLYAMGFQHNNCGGACVKAGQASWRLLLEQLPSRYAYHESKEQEFRAWIGKDVAILRDRTGGTTKAMTLRDFRERIEAGRNTDQMDWGACSCFDTIT